MNSMDADAFAFLTDGVLSIGNERVLRRFRWNEGHLVSLSIEDRQRNAVWAFDGLVPDLHLPGEAIRATDGSLRVTRVEATPFAAAHLRAEVGFCLGELRVRRCFRVYPDAPAIACDTYLAGRAAAQVWQSHGAAPGELAAIESLQAAQQGKRLVPVTERLAGANLHLRHTAVQFFDVTDRNNNLVHARTILPYRQPTELTGSILLTEDRMSDLGLFILKEAPLSDVQLCWPGADFVCQHGEIRVLGVGMRPADVLDDEWTSGYGTVVGVGRANQDDLCMALRRYQLQARRYDASENTLVLNTWGDRNRDARLNESFTLSELDAAARLGVTHLQLDDGWQAGRSGNSAFAGGTFDGIWDREDFWAVHPEKFPNGLRPIVDHANRHRLHLGLWYNPSKDNDYANWHQDAEQIVRLHRTHGVTLFKIDGVDIATKRAERNLGRMLEHACTATQGAIRFNLDVTAGRRFGYFVLNEYGNKFLENRY
ncbi:MAG: alpha-galactosidase, partial [Tepidisphaeraceae bacterium]